MQIKKLLLLSFLLLLGCGDSDLKNSGGVNASGVKIEVSPMDEPACTYRPWTSYLSNYSPAWNQTFNWTVKTQFNNQPKAATITYKIWNRSLSNRYATLYVDGSYVQCLIPLGTPYIFTKNVSECPSVYQVVTALKFTGCGGTGSANISVEFQVSSPHWLGPVNAHTFVVQ